MRWSCWPRGPPSTHSRPWAAGLCFSCTAHHLRQGEASLGGKDVGRGVPGPRALTRVQLSLTPVFPNLLGRRTLYKMQAL